MIRYTTPLLSFFIKDYELIDTDNIYATFADKMRGVFLTVNNMESPVSGTRGVVVNEVGYNQIEISHKNGGTVVDINLTQEQTALFPTDQIVSVQVNWVMSNGRRLATNIVNVDCSENLIPRVLDYDGGGVGNENDNE